MMNVKMMSGLAVAFACIGLQAEPYADRWVHGSRKLNTEADVEFYETLVERMGKSGYNGLLISKGIEGAWRMKGSVRDRWMRLKAACDKNGIEIIPLIWSLGYGTMTCVDPTVIESEPASGFPYVVKNGKAVAEEREVPLKNAGFEEADPSGKRIPGWTADLFGTAVTIDHEVVHSGKASVRIEPESKYGKRSRVFQRIPVKPGRRYRYTAWMKIEKADPGFVRLVVATDDKPAAGPIIPFRPKPGDTEWREVVAEFSAGNSEYANVYFGVWRNTGGRFWVDDAKVVEVGLGQVCLRKGTPFVVRDSASGAVYDEGRDYLLPKNRVGERMTFAVVPGGRLKEGARVTVDAYVPAVYGKGQIAACPSDPRLYELFEKSADGMVEMFHPKKWFLSVDELRSGNTCPLCTVRKTDMAHLLGDSVTRMCKIIRSRCPDAQIYSWSDMFDPNHNAHDNYYGCKGTFEGSWNLIPKDIIISCWYREKANLSAAFFHKLGFRIHAAGYYDRTEEDTWKDTLWLDELNRYPGSTGWMYTTWENQFDLLEKYGEFMNKGSHPKPLK